MPHQGGFLSLGADHIARCVAQHQDRNIEGVAQLHEARGLVRSLAVNRAPQMLGIVGDNPNRPPFDAGKGGDHAQAEVTPDFQHRVGVG